MGAIEAGRLAPDFSLSATDGKTYSLAEARKDSWVLAAFFKVSCPVCQYAFPFIERIFKAAGTKGIQTWGISQDDARESKAFARDYGLSFPVLTDAKGYPVSNKYGLTNVPTVFLINEKGEVLVSSVGFSKQDLLDVAKLVGEHVGGKKIEVFKPREDVPDFKPG
jgi:peroxiredoxin